MTVRLVIDRPYGRLEIEGENFDDLIKRLESLPDYLEVIDQLLLKPKPPSTREEELKGLIEFTTDGPLVIVPKEKVNIKEAIGLLLVATDPTPTDPKELSKLLNLSGKLSPGFAARLSELKHEGRVVREGDAYRLSAEGKNWINEVITRLRG